jgi:hypothetical protein
MKSDETTLQIPATAQAENMSQEVASRVTTPTRKQRSRDQRVRRFRGDLVKVAPHLNQRKFAPLLSSFARISILALDSYEFLRTAGLTGENGELRSSVTTVAGLINSQLRLASALLLTPAALGKLKGESPDDLAAAMARVVGGAVESDESVPE